MLDYKLIEGFCFYGYTNHIKLVIRLYENNQLSVDEFFTLISPICVDPERRGKFREYIKETLNYDGEVNIIH